MPHGRLARRQTSRSRRCSDGRKALLLCSALGAPGAADAASCPPWGILHTSRAEAIFVSLRGFGQCSGYEFDQRLSGRRRSRPISRAARRCSRRKIRSAFATVGVGQRSWQSNRLEALRGSSSSERRRATGEPRERNTTPTTIQQSTPEIQRPGPISEEAIICLLEGHAPFVEPARRGPAHHSTARPAAESSMLPPCRASATGKDRGA